MYRRAVSASSASPCTAKEEALVALGRGLRDAGYRYVTVTPETHGRVVAKNDRMGETLRDVFGWSRRFPSGVLPSAMMEALRAADALEEIGGTFRSRVRFSTLGSGLYVHSAYPTTEADAVFFGPDTYRFCAFLQRSLAHAAPIRRLVDVGCGTGAGALCLAAIAESMTLGDINRAALSFARVNVALASASRKVEIRESDVLAGVAGEIDVVVANPPYLVDPKGRVYRDGGDAYGTALAVRIADEALRRLARGGRLALYTGAPIVEGTDELLRRVRPLLEDARAVWSYEELDPDVFGEELDTPAYAAVERIAAVGLVATLPG